VLTRVGSATGTSLGTIITVHSTSFTTTLTVPASRLIYDIPWCALSMASNQIDIPQPPLQQTVMTSHHPHPHPTTAAATMANRNERATSPIPKWLLPINGKRQTNRLGPAVFAAASTSTQTSRSSHNHIQTQRRPSVPQHGLEPSATAHQIISTSPSPAPMSDNSAKRKTPDVAPRDEEQRDCHPRHVTTSLNGRGGVRENGIWISPDEGANIMMEATMALKNSRRRVTMSGCESHPKRARMVANDPNDGEFSRFL
jgi:hypothetical protein